MPITNEYALDEFMLDSNFDFNERSLIDAALLIESELFGASVEELKNSLRLLEIILKSKLTRFKSPNKGKLEKLLNFLFHEQNFKGDWEAFYEIDNTLLSKVISRRKGVPITLGILLIDLLDKAGFQTQGICFPSGFIVKINLDNEVIYLDPFTGELPSWNDLELKVRGQLGNHARLTLDMLKPDTNQTIIIRLLNVIKASAIQAESFSLALVCSDILLRLEPEDAYEIRDRGFLFQQLDCFNLASNDFEYFIEHHPKDPIVAVLKRQIAKLRVQSGSQIIH